MHRILLALAAVFLLTGCWWNERADTTREALAREAAELRAEAAKRQAEYDALKASVDAAALVATTDEDRERLAKLRKGLHDFEGAIVSIDRKAMEIEARIQALPEGATNGQLVMAAATPIVLQVAPRLLAGVPGLGFLAPLAAAIANATWNAQALRRQKEEDERNAKLAQQRHGDITALVPVVK